MEAQVTGLQRLMQRLTPQTEHSRLPAIKGNDITSYVMSVSVDDEKTSSGRYIARLSVRYDPQTIRSLLQTHGIPYTEPRASILTLPILKAEGRTILWEDPNPWRQAWASLPVDPVIPMIVPLGELEDVTQLPTDKIAGVGMDDLGPIMSRYDAADVFVITAVLSQHDASPITAEVSLRSIGPTAPDIEIPRTFMSREGETLDTFLSRTASSIVTAITTTYKKDNSINHAQTGNLRATVRFSGLAEWQSVRERLGKIPAIHKIDIDILGRTEAFLSLQIVGDPAVFQSIFSQYGLSFAPGSNSQPALIMSVSPTPPLTPPLAEEESSSLEIPE